MIIIVFCFCLFCMFRTRYTVFNTINSIYHRKVMSMTIVKPETVSDDDLARIRYVLKFHYREIKKLRQVLPILCNIAWEFFKANQKFFKFITGEDCYIIKYTIIKMILLPYIPDIDNLPRTYKTTIVEYIIKMLIAEGYKIKQQPQKRARFAKYILCKE